MQNPLWEEGRWYRVDLQGARGLNGPGSGTQSVLDEGDPPHHRECICVRDHELVVAAAAGELEEGSEEAAAYERLVQHFRDAAVNDCNEVAEDLGLTFPANAPGVVTCETAVENDLPPYQESDKTCGATKGECFAPEGWGGSGGSDDGGDGSSSGGDDSTSADGSEGDVEDDGDGPDESELDPRDFLGIARWSEIVHAGGARGVYLVEGWAVDELRQNPTVMLNDTSLVGFEDCGIRIHQAPAGSFLGSLGLTSGNCIHSINDIEIRDADTAIEAFNELSTAPNLRAWVSNGPQGRWRTLQLFFD